MHKPRLSLQGVFCRIAMLRIGMALHGNKKQVAIFGSVRDILI
jgi:hypothetical protein